MTEDPKDAIARSIAVTMTGKSQEEKGPGLTPPNVFGTFENGVWKPNAPAVAPDPARQTPKAPKGTIHRKLQEDAATRASRPIAKAKPRPQRPDETVTSKLRQTPGTLERAMTGVDADFPNLPKAKRDEIKYRIQSLIKADPKKVVTRAEAKNIARVSLGQNPKEVRQPAATEIPTGLEMAGDALANALTGIYELPEGFTKSAINIARPATAQDHPDRIMEAIELARQVQSPDPTSLVGDRRAGKFLQGATDVLNPGMAVTGPSDAIQLAIQLMLGETMQPGQGVVKPPSVVESLVGPAGQERDDNLWRLGGGLVGGAALGKLTTPAKVKAPKGVRKPPVVETPKVEVSKAEPVAKIETPVAKTEPIAPKPTKGRALVTEAIEEQIKVEDVAEAKPQVVEKPPAQPPKPKKQTIRTPSGEKVDVQTKVVERSSLRVSHNVDDFGANADYPSFAQPRDRSLPGEREKIRRQAENLDPEMLLEDFKSTDRGAPVIGSDGVVESGNGRVMSIDYAKKHFPEAYKRYLDEVRTRHPEAAGMKDPVLVQERVGAIDDATRRKFAEQSNEGSSSQMGNVEIARADVDKLPKNLEERFEMVGRDLESALKSPKNRVLVHEFVSSLPDTEKAAMFDSDGNLSLPARERLARAIVAKALGGDSSDTLYGIFQDADFSLTIAGGIEQAAADLMNIRKAGGLGGEMADTISESLKLVDQAMKAGRTRRARLDWFEQGSMMDDRDPSAMKIGKMLVEAKSKERAADLLRRLAKAGGDADGGMFSDELAFKSVKEAVDAAFEGVIAEDLPTAKARPVGQPSPLKTNSERVNRSNYRTPLTEHTEVLYREVSPEGYQYLVTMQADDASRVYFANDPDMALGQGGNKGILVELDADGIQGQVSTEKPTWATAYDNGAAEFVGSLNSGGRYFENIRSLTIKPDVKFDKSALIRWKRAVKELTDSGWVKETLEDGSTRYVRPDVAGKGSRPMKGMGSGRRGAADIKTLATVAGISGVAAGLILGRDQIEDFLKKHGLPREALVAAGALGLVGYAALKGRKGATMIPEKNFTLATGALDWREVAVRAVDGDRRASRLFGEALLGVTDAQYRHTLATGQAYQQMQKIASDVFGGKGAKFLKSREFQDMDLTVRDRMETNINEGRAWDDGLTDKEKTFVSRIRSEVMDPILDRWESEGGRILVRNDGTQQNKMQPGAVVRLPSGKWGAFEGFEPSTAKGTPDDPFSLEGGFESPGVDLKFSVLSELDELGTGGTTETVIVRPGEKFGRPVNRLGDSFVPRVYSESFLRKLRTIKSRAFNDALTKMLEEQNPGMGLTADTLMGKLVDIADSLENTGTDIHSFMANLEKERLMTLAKFEYVDDAGRTIVVDPYESSYLGSAARYVDRGWKRVAVAEQFGVDPRALGSLVRAVKAADSEYGMYLEKGIGRLLHLGDQAPRDNVWAKGARAEGMYQSITKLTGGTTHIAQFGDMIMPASEAGIIPMLKAIVKVTANRALRDDMAVLAAADANWLGEIRGQELQVSTLSTGRKLAKGARKMATKGERFEGMEMLSDGIWSAIGLRSVDRFVKGASMLAVAEDAMSTLRKAAGAKVAGKQVAGSVARKLARYGLADQVDRAAKLGAEAVMADEKVLATFAGNARRTMMYTGAAIDNPAWTSTPGGALMTRFKKPLYVTTRFILHNVMSEAGKGNFKPMARFVVAGVGAGTLATAAKDLFRMEWADDEFRKQWGKGNYEEAFVHAFGKLGENTLLNENKRKSLQSILYHAGKGIYDAGAAGAAGEFIPSYNRRVADLTGNYAPDMSKVAAPVSLNSLQTVLTNIFEKKSDIPDENWKQWRESVQDSIESEIIPIRRVVAALGAQAPLTKLKTIVRKMQARDKDPNAPRLSPAELQWLKANGYSERGRFNEIRKLIAPGGMKYSDAVFEAIGTNKDFTIPKPR